MKVEYTQEEITEQISEILEPLTEAQREFLALNLLVQKYKKGEVIYSEGDSPQYFFCLLEGKVKISKDGVGGRSQIVRVLKSVDYFGFHSYFAQTNYVCSAVALESATVCLIPIRVMAQLLRDNSLLGLKIISLLSANLNEADVRTVSLTQKHVRGRLAEALLLLQNSYGMEDDKSTLSIYLSREDLANLSNMTTSNAIRTLSAFAAEDLVKIDGRKIKITNLKALKKISEVG